MTVCIAAVASSGSVIVCVADKVLGYGDGIVGDSDSTKIVPLNAASAIALTAGTEGHVARFLRKIQNFDGYRGEIGGIAEFLEREYRHCFEEIRDVEVLLPNGMNRAQYVAAISSAATSAIITSTNAKMVRFSQTYDCELLICGFSEGAQPYILKVGPPSKIEDYSEIGVHAIGVGAAHAMGRLQFVEHKRTDNVAHTLFDCFDAKARAEISLHAGYEWEGYLITETGSRALVSEAKPLIDRVWTQRNMSPFKKKKAAGDLPDPPKGWELKLRMMVTKSLGKVPANDENTMSKLDDH